MLSDAGYEAGYLTHWYFEKRKRAGLDRGFSTWCGHTRWGKAMEDVSTSEARQWTVKQLGGPPTSRGSFGSIFSIRTNGTLTIPGLTVGGGVKARIDTIMR